LIAATFALAGGAHGVSYPARTLYENEVESPASLHDVLEGSNGSCGKPFNKKTGVSGCTPEQEAAASCESQARCLARKGYDGPTGVGTPNGIGAFQPSKEGGGEPSQEVVSGHKEAAGEAGGSAGSPAPVSSNSPGPGGGGSPAASATTVQISRLALTLNAILALNRTRPRASQVGFTFNVNAAVLVRAALSKRVRAHGHARWQTLPDSTTIAAAAGRNSRRLGGHNALAPGLYRLTLTPAHGAARSIVFVIG
ncbi:MAG TPA: hypothetical protein VEW68_07575, partial [Patescibacteria group bacterium]|nr:hypothetical protein [Patescibacteria group bacterium]